MSDDEEFEKTQIYLPPGKGGAGRSHASKPLHEVLLKPQKEASPPAETPSVDFDITGAAPPAPQDRPAVDFDITGADVADPVPPPAARGPKPAAPPAPEPKSKLGVVVVAILVIAIIAFFALR